MSQLRFTLTSNTANTWQHRESLTERAKAQRNASIQSVALKGRSLPASRTGRRKLQQKRKSDRSNSNPPHSSHAKREVEESDRHVRLPRGWTIEVDADSLVASILGNAITSVSPSTDSTEPDAEERRLQSKCAPTLDGFEICPSPTLGTRYRKGGARKRKSSLSRSKISEFATYTAAADNRSAHHNLTGDQKKEAARVPPSFSMKHSPTSVADVAMLVLKEMGLVLKARTDGVSSDHISDEASCEERSQKNKVVPVAPKQAFCWEESDAQLTASCILNHSSQQGEDALSSAEFENHEAEVDSEWYQSGSPSTQTTEGSSVSNEGELDNVKNNAFDSEGPCNIFQLLPQWLLNETEGFQNLDSGEALSKSCAPQIAGAAEIKSHPLKTGPNMNCQMPTRASQMTENLRAKSGRPTRIDDNKRIFSPAPPAPKFVLPAVSGRDYLAMPHINASLDSDKMSLSHNTKLSPLLDKCDLDDFLRETSIFDEDGLSEASLESIVGPMLFMDSATHQLSPLGSPTIDSPSPLAFVSTWGGDAEDLYTLDDDLSIPSTHFGDFVANARLSTQDAAKSGKEHHGAKRQTAVLSSSNPQRSEASPATPIVTAEPSMQPTDQNTKAPTSGHINTGLSASRHVSQRQGAIESPSTSDMAKDTPGPTDKVASSGRKRKRDPSRPKGYISAFNFFALDLRKAMVEMGSDHQGKGQNENNNLNVKIGKAWKVLPPQQKAFYDEKARVDKLRYLKEMSSYQPSQGFTRLAPRIRPLKDCTWRGEGEDHDVSCQTTLSLAIESPAEGHQPPLVKTSASKPVVGVNAARQLSAKKRKTRADGPPQTSASEAPSALNFSRTEQAHVDSPTKFRCSSGKNNNLSLQAGTIDDETTFTSIAKVNVEERASPPSSVPLPGLEMETKNKIPPMMQPPRRPWSPYICFVREHNKLIKQQYSSLTFTKIGRILGQKWRQMTVEQRQRYVDIAKIDAIRFEKETREWDRKIAEFKMTHREEYDLFNSCMAVSLAGKVNGETVISTGIVNDMATCPGDTKSPNNSPPSTSAADDIVKGTDHAVSLQLPNSLDWLALEVISSSRDDQSASPPDSGKECGGGSESEKGKGEHRVGVVEEFARERLDDPACKNLFFSEMPSDAQNSAISKFELAAKMKRYSDKTKCKSKARRAKGATTNVSSKSGIELLAKTATPSSFKGERQLSKARRKKMNGLKPHVIVPVTKPAQ